MLYLGKLRKDILHALDRHIIPDLESAAPKLMYVDFPFKHPPAIRSWKISAKNLSEKNATLHKWGCREWKRDYLIAKNHPYLVFVYRGAVQKRVALSREQHRDLRRKNVVSPGIFAAELKAPGAFYFPPETFHNSGGRIFWEEEHPEEASYAALSFSILPSMLLVHHTEAAQGKHQGDLPLQVDDADLLLLARLFAEELENARERSQRLACTYLLIFMSRLRKHIPHAICANTFWPVIPDIDPSVRDAKEARIVFESAISYIQLRLHEKLTLTGIAQHLHVSPQHLNRIFTQAIQMTVMHFVVSQRIKAAQAMLERRPDWPLQEVASLVGFDNYMSFYKAFSREVGCSPNEYRKQSLQQSGN